jgi:hypothetical protein
LGLGELDPECANVNDCAVDGVLRRHSPYYFKFLGADKTVSENRSALDSLFASMKASK